MAAFAVELVCAYATAAAACDSILLAWSAMPRPSWQVIVALSRPAERNIQESCAAMLLLHGTPFLSLLTSLPAPGPYQPHPKMTSVIKGFARTSL